MRLRFGLFDALLVWCLVGLLVGLYYSRSLIAIGVGINIAIAILMFSKPLLERVHIKSQLLQFPTTLLEWIVVIAIIAYLNWLLFQPVVMSVHPP
jgi:hypothetical protein